MELKRFFVEPSDITNYQINITGQEYNHIVKVMRYRKGYKLIVSCGDGYDYHSIISEINEQSIICDIEEKLLNNNNAFIKVNLYAAQIKEDNYELIVQKAVELGVNSITPIITDYVSEKKLRIDRLIKIAIDASKQCGRASIPKINEPITLLKALDKVKESDLSIMAYEKEKDITLKEIIRANNIIESVSIIIGPEGGFSEEEKDLIDNNNITKFTLGRRILRAETASIVSLGIIMYELDK